MVQIHFGWSCRLHKWDTIEIVFTKKKKGSAALIVHNKYLGTEFYPNVNLAFKVFGSEMKSKCSVCSWKLLL